MLDCVFASPLPIKPASLGFNRVPFGSSLRRYILPVPSKLNNVILTLHLVLTLGHYERNLVSYEVSLERR